MAGTALAWRLSDNWPPIEVHLFTGRPTRIDASAVSGGMVRVFDKDPIQCLNSGASLTELRSSAKLRKWSGYQEIGSTFLLAGAPTDLGPVLSQIERVIPGSVSLLTAEQMVDAGWFRDLPHGTLAVVERHAGYLSPDRLRNNLLAHLVAKGMRVTERPVTAVTTDGRVRYEGGGPIGFDVVVAAAGAWTPALLRRSGLSSAGLRTKAIQYLLVGTKSTGWRGVFIDETTGLYGRPVSGNRFLLGLPTDRWDVGPGALSPDLLLNIGVLEVASRRLGLGLAAPQISTHTAVECYHSDPGLKLRPVESSSRLYSFTGGSGGAAKTVLAASQRAAAKLAQQLALGSATK